MVRRGNSEDDLSQSVDSVGAWDAICEVDTADAVDGGEVECWAWLESTSDG